MFRAFPQRTKNAIIETMENIVLASASPRRLDFFRLLGLPFVCVPADIDETLEPGLSPGEVAESLARQKALTVAGKLGAFIGTAQSVAASNACASPGATQGANADAPPRWVFAADTVVAPEGEILGKPESREEARRMLERLAGREHRVVTAMALHDRLTGTTDCRSATCAVEFAPLSPEEIEWYLDTGEWRGAAGGYRLQERGGCLVKAVKGHPGAVAGLPLRDFYVMLRDNGYPFGA